MRYIASIDTEPPTWQDFTDPDAAIAWAREHAGRRTWVVSELPDDAGAGPPRTIASTLGDDVERPTNNEQARQLERDLRAEDEQLDQATDAED